MNETGRKNARMDGGGWKDTVTDLPRVTIFRVHLEEKEEEARRRRRRKWERGVATTDRNVNTRQRLDEKGTKGNSSKGTRKKKKKKKKKAERSRAGDERHFILSRFISS